MRYEVRVDMPQLKGTMGSNDIRFAQGLFESIIHFLRLPADICDTESNNVIDSVSADFLGIPPEVQFDLGRCSDCGEWVPVRLNQSLLVRVAQTHTNLRCQGAGQPVTEFRQAPRSAREDPGPKTPPVRRKGRRR